MNTMHNPAHPGEVLRSWLPETVTVTAAAESLHVSRVLLSRILNGHTAISADMALRLANYLGTAPDTWLAMQTQYDQWAPRKAKCRKVKALAGVAARA